MGRRLPQLRSTRGIEENLKKVLNFLRRLALPPGVKHWSPTTLREKLVKIGAKVTWHAKSVTFQLAEAAVPRKWFQAILRRMARLRTTVPVLEPR